MILLCVLERKYQKEKQMDMETGAGSIWYRDHLRIRSGDSFLRLPGVGAIVTVLILSDSIPTIIIQCGDNRRFI